MSLKALLSKLELSLKRLEKPPDHYVEHAQKVSVFTYDVSKELPKLIKATRMMREALDKLPEGLIEDWFEFDPRIKADKIAAGDLNLEPRL